MAIENKIRQRLDLQETRRQQLHFKEQKRQAELEEEEEFRRKVRAVTTMWSLFNPSSPNIHIKIVQTDFRTFPYT